MDSDDALRRRLREALRDSPSAAYRDWFRAQEELKQRGAEAAARALAHDLWEDLPSLRFDSADERARFFHNVGVFFGTPGPAADLGRARSALAEAVAHYAAPDETGWRARALHNLATAISNLATSAAELAEAASLFDEALVWRTSEREIARGVTLHHLGIALCRWADLDPPRAPELLDRSVEALREAAAIRERLGLAEGLAATQEALEVARSRRPGTAGRPDRAEDDSGALR